MDHFTAKILCGQKQGKKLFMNFLIQAESLQLGRFAAPPMSAEKSMKVCRHMFQLESQILQLWIDSGYVKFSGWIDGPCWIENFPNLIQRGCWSKGREMKVVAWRVVHYLHSSEV